MFIAAGNLSGVPVYIGEWNNVDRDKVINEEGDFVYEINPEEVTSPQQTLRRF